jgi:hypothetical protein
MIPWSKRLAAVSRYIDVHGPAPKPVAPEVGSIDASSIELRESPSKPADAGNGSSYLASYSIGRRELLFAGVFLALICLLTHYLRLWSYGLYEDDYAAVSPAFAMSLDYLVASVKYLAHSWTQGRPVGWSLEYTGSFVAFRLGGLHALYFLEYLVLTVDAFLCYLVLRSRLAITYAAVGAVFFCAYPADTSQLFAATPFFQHAAAIAVFLGAIAYARRRWVLCYALFATAFLTYESMCMPFLMLPLLFRDRSRTWLSQVVSHFLVVYSGILTALAIRTSMGESRVTELHGQLGATMDTAFHAMEIGPLEALKAAAQRPLDVLEHLDLGLLLVLAVSAALIIAYWRLLPVGPTGRGTLVIPFRSRFVGLSGGFEVANALPRIASVCGLGFVLLVLGYCLAFLHPWFFPYGRLSIVHFAGAFGGAMMMGGLVWLTVFVAEGYGRQKIVLILVALYLGSLVSFHNIVQRDFSRAWQTERRFWSEVVRLCPDLEDGTLVLHQVATNALPMWSPDTFVLPNSWSDGIILTQLFQFPSTWHRPPRLFTITSNWKDNVQDDGAGPKWLIPATGEPEHWEPLDLSKLIVLRQTGPGTFTRLSGTIHMAGKDYMLKQTGTAVNSLPTKPLFQYLCR